MLYCETEPGVENLKKLQNKILIKIFLTDYRKTSDRSQAQIDTGPRIAAGGLIHLY